MIENIPAVLGSRGLRMALLCACLMAADARGQSVAVSGPSGPTGVSIGTNVIAGLQYYPLPTNYVVTTISSNIYANPVTFATNTVTNTYTGLMDISKESSFAVQTGLVGSAGITNTNAVVFYFRPGLDSTNIDTGNSVFYVTNYLNSNSPSISTTNFAPAICGMINTMWLVGISNTSTNAIYPGLLGGAAGTGGSNWLQYSGKRMIFQ